MKEKQSPRASKESIPSGEYVNSSHQDLREPSQVGLTHRMQEPYGGIVDLETRLEAKREIRETPNYIPQEEGGFRKYMANIRDAVKGIFEKGLSGKIAAGTLILAAGLGSPGCNTAGKAYSAQLSRGMAER
ncbi:MAG: hypothetical protein NUV97_00670, partial [archaeon]|nr:hypothetical protein [archaeon]MCR4323342.1 hypothetical protein [Nanoarchaeota archaeon]